MKTKTKDGLKTIAAAAVATMIFCLMGIALVNIQGCGTVGIGMKKYQPCIVDMPDGSQMPLSEFCGNPNTDSEICKLGAKTEQDPCIVHRGMEVVAKEVLIIEGYTAEEFEAEAQKIKDKIASGITWQDAKYWIASYFLKFNRIVGAQVLILTDTFVQLPQDAIIKGDDVILMNSSIDDLVAEVKRLAVWLS